MGIRKSACNLGSRDGAIFPHRLIVVVSYGINSGAR